MNLRGREEQSVTESFFSLQQKNITVFTTVKNKVWTGHTLVLRQPKSVPCRKTYINPDVGGLFIDYVWLCVTGHSLQTLLPLSWVVCDGDEEGWRQQDQLELPLTAVQKHCPATRGTQSTQNSLDCTIQQDYSHNPLETQKS